MRVYIRKIDKKPLFQAVFLWDGSETETESDKLSPLCSRCFPSVASVVLTYCFRSRMIEMIRKMQMKPARRKPTTPMRGISLHFGGMPECTMIDEPTTSAPTRIDNETRLLTRS